MNIKNLKVLVWDLGLQAELAKTIAEKAAEVKYYVPANMECYPEPLKDFIGKGLEGVERVKEFFPYVDQADVIIIPEAQLGCTTGFLRRHGYPVAGPDERHTWLEYERWKARVAQSELGLPTQDSESIIGVDALSKFFDTNSDWVVKGNGYRGLFDSFVVKDKKDIEPHLNYFRYKLGPFCNDLPFMVERRIEGLETGYDAISWNRTQVWPSLLSLAAKDEGYLCKICTESEMPPGYRLMHKLLSKELAEYRFFYSVETITGKDQVPYLIDLTMRIGSSSPLSIYLELYENFAEVLCGMALGEQVDPITRTKYAASVNLILGSFGNTENFTNISIPKGVRRFAKLIRGCRKSEDYYACPEWAMAVTVVATGNSVKEVIKLAQERSAEISGKDLIDCSVYLDHYYKDIEEAKAIGINF